MPGYNLPLQPCPWIIKNLKYGWLIVDHLLGKKSCYDVRWTFANIPEFRTYVAYLESGNHMPSSMKPSVTYPPNCCCRRTCRSQCLFFFLLVQRKPGWYPRFILFSLLILLMTCSSAFLSFPKLLSSDMSWQVSFKLWTLWGQGHILLKFKKCCRSDFYHARIKFKNIHEIQ